jgi:hypothetical protein
MGTGLASCDTQNWNEWLADDVVLSLSLSAVDINRIGNRHEAKQPPYLSREQGGLLSRTRKTLSFRGRHD